MYFNVFDPNTSTNTNNNNNNTHHKQEIAAQATYR